MSKGAKPDVWMPLYVNDWDDKTGNLDCEQDGAYGRLVRWYWKSGPLPDDDAQLARIVRMERARWRKVRPVIAAFFHIRDGRWFHERVEEELERARDIIEKRRQAGSQGGRPRKQTESKPKANGSANGNQTGLQNETPARVEVASSEVDNQLSYPYQEVATDSQDSAAVVRFPLDGRLGR